MKVKEESEKTGLKLSIQKLRSRHLFPSLHGKKGKSGNSDRFYFLGLQNHCSDRSHEIKMSAPWKKAMTNLNSVLKSRDITLPTKVHIVKAMVFQVVMWGCERWIIKGGWVLKNWCFQFVVLEKTLESSLDSKEIKPVNPKGNQPWILIGSIDTEASVLWPPDGKYWLIGKDPDAGKDWRKEENGVTEDEVVV